LNLFKLILLLMPKLIKMQKLVPMLELIQQASFIIFYIN